MTVKFAGIIFMFLVLTGFTLPVFASSSQVSFGLIMNISNNTGLSTEPVIGSVGSHVYVAWEDSTLGQPDVFIAVSGNGGATWSTRHFTGLGSATAVQIAATGPYVYLTWKQGGQTAFARSNDYGLTFGPTTIFSQPTGTVTEPALATNGTSVYLIWAFHSNTNGSDYAMFSVSHDGGTTLSAPKRIDQGHTAHEIQISAQWHYVYVVWDSVWVTRSTDGGKTWSKPFNVKQVGGNGREPMIASSANDVYITWPSSVTGSYQVWMALSHDRAATWTTKQVTTNMTSAREIQVGTCSGSNDQVPCAGTPNVFIAIRGQAPGGGRVNQFIVISHDNGTTFTQPLDLAVQSKNQVGFGGVSIDGTNVFVFWPHTLKSTGIVQMWLQASSDSGATWAGVQQVSASTVGVVGMGDSNSMHDQGPMVSANGGHVYCVWQDDSTGAGDIYFVAGTP